jgi:hypothetical protein
VLAAYYSAADLAEALPCTAAVRGKHEEEIGQAHPDWPDWRAVHAGRAERVGGRHRSDRESPISVTQQIYTHKSTGQDRAAAEMIAGLIAQALGPNEAKLHARWSQSWSHGQ